MSATSESPTPAEPLAGRSAAVFVAAALDERVRSLLDAHERSRDERFQIVAERMSEREAALATFTRLKPLLLEGLLRPRVQALVARFANARATDGDTPEGVSVQAVFARTDRFPVTATLRAGALLDTGRGAVRAFTRVQLVPLLVPPPGDADRDAALGVLLELADGEAADATSRAGAEWRALEDWLDHRLLAFLAAYLATETDPAYQQMTMHVDPVCGMRLPTGSAVARHDFRGHAYYLCSDACDARFTADPAYYVHRWREREES